MWCGLIAATSEKRTQARGITSRLCYTPAPTYFRLSTIIGPTGLTSEFGMGSGVSPQVWAPRKVVNVCQSAVFSLQQLHCGLPADDCRLTNGALKTAYWTHREELTGNKRGIAYGMSESAPTLYLPAKPWDAEIVAVKPIG